MEIKNFTITKRDGSKDQFSLDKIMKDHERHCKGVRQC